VLTESSLASAVVRLARAQGAEVLLTSPLCRSYPLTARVAPRLGITAPVLELDVTLQEDLAGLESAVRAAGWDRIDGVLHAIGYAPDGVLGSAVSSVPWSGAGETLQASAWSLPALVHAVRPLLPRGASVVALDFDGTRAWSVYGWMGIAKAALEAAARYLAQELGPDGIRVNLVAAGPIKTMAARGVPGFNDVQGSWADRAPLGWDSSDPEPVARAVVALLSDWFPATTGEIVHVDGGVHAVG
jgi:enoyl ACP reductase